MRRIQNEFGKLSIYRIQANYHSIGKEFYIRGLFRTPYQRPICTELLSPVDHRHTTAALTQIQRIGKGGVPAACYSHILSVKECAITKSAVTDAVADQHKLLR